MPIYAVNAQNVTAAFRQVAPELDIVDICMNGSELGASIFHERLEQLTHEQPQLRFGLQLGSHAIHVAHDEVDDEVADLAALPNVKLGLTNAGHHVFGGCCVRASAVGFRTTALFREMLEGNIAGWNHMC